MGAKGEQRESASLTEAVAFMCLYFTPLAPGADLPHLLLPAPWLCPHVAERQVAILLKATVPFWYLRVLAPLLHQTTSLAHGTVNKQRRKKPGVSFSYPGFPMALFSLCWLSFS